MASGAHNAPPHPPGNPAAGGQQHGRPPVAPHRGDYGAARQEIAAQLSHGPRGLPPDVANGIAELAGRMAADDVLLHRLRSIVAAEGLGLLTAAPAAVPNTTSSDSSSVAWQHRAGPAAGVSSPPRRAGAPFLTAMPESPGAGGRGGGHAASGVAKAPTLPSPSLSDWDLADRVTPNSSGGRPAAQSPRAPPPSAATLESMEADERAIAELRLLFDEGGAFVLSDPVITPPIRRGASSGSGGSSAVESIGTPAPAVGAAAQSRFSPATPGGHVPSSSTLAAGSAPPALPDPAFSQQQHHHPALVAPTEAANEAEGDRGSAAAGGGHLRTASTPRTPTSAGSTIGSGAAGGAFDAAGMLSSARFFTTDCDIRPFHAQHALRGATPRRGSGPHRGGAAAAGGSADANSVVEGTSVSELWAAIYGCLFVPAAEGGGQANQHQQQQPSHQQVAANDDSEVPLEPPGSDAAVPFGSHQHHHQQQGGSRGRGGASAAQQHVVDEKFLIAAAMLVNSTLLWVLLTRSGKGASAGATTPVCGFSDVVGRVADVVQRAYGGMS